MGGNVDVNGIGVRKNSGVLVEISKKIGDVEISKIGDVEISKKIGDVERVGEGSGVVSGVIATESDVNVGMEAVTDGEIALVATALVDSVGVDTSELSGVSEITSVRRTGAEVSGGKVLVSEAAAVTIGTVVMVAAGITVVSGSSRLILVSVGVGEGKRNSKVVEDVRTAVRLGCEVDTVVLPSKKLGDGVATTAVVETSDIRLNEVKLVVAEEENNSVRVSVGEIVNSAVRMEELVSISDGIMREERVGVSSTSEDSTTARDELEKGSIPDPDPDPNSGVGVGVTVKEVSVLVAAGVASSVVNGITALDISDVVRSEGLSTCGALVKSEAVSTDDGETNSVVGFTEAAGEMEMVADSKMRDVSRATVLVNGATIEVDMVSSTSVGRVRVATACNVSEVVVSDTVSTVGVGVITSEAEVSKNDVDSTEKKSDRRLELWGRTSVAVLLTAVEPMLVGIGRDVGNSSTEEAAKLKLGVAMNGDVSKDGEEGRRSSGIEDEKSSEVIGRPSALDDVSSTLSIVEIGDTTEDAADGCRDCSTKDGVGAKVTVAAEKRVLVATTGLTKDEVMLTSTSDVKIVERESCNVSVSFTAVVVAATDVSAGDGDNVNSCSEGL